MKRWSRQNAFASPIDARAKADYHEAIRLGEVSVTFCAELQVI
jgi:hypothetical protein